ncbi:Tyrosine-protein kinase Mer [Hypsibius exemplaris]|uniref:Tyrosine-protein kinase Mer n=1 Tax=Hypsibius exemplaris TaxID=2072580 RepID=A0A1W0WCG7_HYPEX|nr:Tyrosine-protein kinase Mer [Hypsibius exemplaris]
MALRRSDILTRLLWLTIISVYSVSPRTSDGPSQFQSNFTDKNVRREKRNADAVTAWPLQHGWSILAEPVYSGGTVVTFRNLAASRPPLFRVFRRNEPSPLNQTVCKIVSERKQIACELPAIGSHFADHPATVTLDGELFLDGNPDGTPYPIRDVVYHADPQFIGVTVTVKLSMHEGKHVWVVFFNRRDDFDKLDLTGFVITLSVNRGGSIGMCGQLQARNNLISCVVQYVHVDPHGLGELTIRYGNVVKTFHGLPLERLNGSEANVDHSSTSATATHTVVITSSSTSSATTSSTVTATTSSTTSSATTSSTVTVTASSTLWLVVGLLSGTLVVVFFAVFAYYQRRPDSFVRRLSTRVRSGDSACRNHPTAPHWSVNRDSEAGKPLIYEGATVVSTPAEAVNGPNYRDTTLPLPGPGSDHVAVIRHGGNRDNAVHRLSVVELNARIALVVRTLKLEKFVIKQRDLSIHSKPLGKGAGGTVYKGTLYPHDDRRQDVAVKCLREYQLSSEELVTKFLKECAVMVQMSHENVMRLAGICMNEANGNLDPQLIIPFMPNGDLRKYVSLQPLLALHTVLDFSMQIAKGMRYLSSELPGQRIVHRDLAARNCMLDEDTARGMRVVVTDFGLSRDVYQAEDAIYVDTHPAEMPVRWLAPECFERSHYSTKSDVWSFGVVIWEILTRGEVPYEALLGGSANLVLRLKRFLARGGRLPRPSSCPVELYSLMNRCWSASPDNRPSFDKLCTDLEVLRTQDPLTELGYLRPLS